MKGRRWSPPCRALLALLRPKRAMVLCMACTAPSEARAGPVHGMHSSFRSSRRSCARHAQLLPKLVQVLCRMSSAPCEANNGAGRGKLCHFGAPAPPFPPCSEAFVTCAGTEPACAGPVHATHSTCGSFGRSCACHAQDLRELRTELCAPCSVPARASLEAMHGGGFPLGGKRDGRARLALSSTVFPAFMPVERHGRKLKGRSRGHHYNRWPNAFFAEQGLYSFMAAYAHVLADLGWWALLVLKTTEVTAKAFAQTCLVTEGYRRGRRVASGRSGPPKKRQAPFSQDLDELRSEVHS
jgi:hypothetical protein